MNEYKLAIIGGGPAGVSAGVYASRKQIKTLFIAPDFGGQSIVSEGIQNWIGEVEISGQELANKLKNHLEAYAGEYVDIKKEYVDIIEKKDNKFKIKTNETEYLVDAILITTGSSRKKLPVLGADRLEHKGLTYCASCDGPLFVDKNVAVIGGGNSALESAAQLSAYAKSVKLIHRRAHFRGDAVTVEALKKDPEIEFILNTEIIEVLGDKFVSGLKYKNKENQEEKDLEVEGIFVEIGSIPNSKFVKELLKTNENGNIEIDPWTQRTSVEGIWAAGDVTNVRYHQNNIASGDAVKALEDIHTWLKQQQN